MITGLNINETIPFVSKYDKEEHKTVFHLGMLDPFIEAYIEEKSGSFEFHREKGESGAHASANLGLQRADILRVQFGLKGLDNFMDPETKQPVKFDTLVRPINGISYQAVCERIVRMIHPDIIAEVAEAIKIYNKLGKDAEKNS